MYPTMTIIEDDRNKAGKHCNVHDYCDRHGITVLRKRLKYGDYMLSEDDIISVDTKRNLDEVSTNLASKDSSRFWTEIREAHKKGVKIVLLVEHGGGIHSIEDVAKWRSRHTGISGRQLIDKMYELHIAYGAEWIFCDKRSTGRRIVEILTTERDKWLNTEPWS